MIKDLVVRQDAPDHKVYRYPQITEQKYRPVSYQFGGTEINHQYNFVACNYHRGGYTPQKILETLRILCYNNLVRSISGGGYRSIGPPENGR